MTAIRCPMVIASTWSWVTYSVVVSRRCCRRYISVRICMRSVASRLESGSSMRKACGRRARCARASATRWRWPPESWPGRRSSSSPRPRVSADFAHAPVDLGFRRVAGATGTRCSWPPSGADRGRRTGRPSRRPGPCGSTSFTTRSPIRMCRRSRPRVRPPCAAPWSSRSPRDRGGRAARRRRPRGRGGRPRRPRRNAS